MEEVVAEHLRVEHAHALRGERLAVDAGGVERGDVVATGCRARAPASARARRCATRSTSGTYRSGEPSQKRRSTRGIGAFALQVEFGGERVLDLGDDLARADLVGGRMRAVDQRRDRACSSAMSSAICRSMPGRSTLTTTSRGGASPIACSVAACTCAIEADASGVVSKLANATSIGAAERLLDQRARGVAVERRDAVLQQRQFVGDVRRHQVAARRQDLPELDEDRPELLQRQAQARAARLRRDLAARRAARTAASASASVRPACRRAGRRAGSAAARGRSAAARSAGVMRAARARQARDARGQAFDVVAQRIDVVVEGIQLGASRRRRAIPR